MSDTLSDTNKANKMASWVGNDKDKKGTTSTEQAAPVVVVAGTIVANEMPVVPAIPAIPAEPAESIQPVVAVDEIDMSKLSFFERSKLKAKRLASTAKKASAAGNKAMTYEATPNQGETKTEKKKEKMGFMDRMKSNANKLGAKIDKVNREVTDVLEAEYDPNRKEYQTNLKNVATPTAKN